MHIPKSAGTSIVAALLAALPEGAVAPPRMDASIFCGFDRFDLMSPSARSLIVASRADVDAMRDYQVACGHFSLSTMLELTSPESIGTILREPRSRVLSLYLYWRLPGIFDGMRPYDMQPNARQSVEAFVSDVRLAPVVDNAVCRMLLHGSPAIPRDGFVADSDVASVAAQAVAQLNRFAAVGVVELDFHAWEAMGRLFEVTLAPQVLNVTGEAAAPFPAPLGEALLTPAALDLLAMRNAADQIVYEYALERAGVERTAGRRLAEFAFASELVKLGDLLGSSARESAASRHARV